MIKVIDKARYLNVRIGRRDLKRLLGMLPYVNLDAAALRFSHPYSKDEGPEKDLDLIRRLNIATNTGAKDD